MLIRDIIPEPEASVIADVLYTVGEVRRAADDLRRLRARDGHKHTFGAQDQIDRAEGYVRELRELIESRARSAGMDADDLIALAGAVLDRRRRLPDGVEPLEVA